MPYHVTVLYPKNPSSTFDMDYYLSSHMPLVLNTWKDEGLIGYTVKEFEKGPDGSDPKMMVQCDLNFGSKADLEKAMQNPGVKAIFDDVPKFTNESPLFLPAANKGEGGSKI